MADRKIAYGTDGTLAITSVTSLASSTTLVAGGESAEFDNTTNKFVDVLIGGKVTTGTSPTAARLIEVWVIPRLEDTPVWPDVFDGTDSAETVTTRDILLACGRLAAQMATDSTSNRTYWWGAASVAELFGGSLPPKFSVFIVHNTGVALNATGTNHALYTQPVYETVV